jgi:methionine sulfoxide reductase heme-binding subunit
VKTYWYLTRSTGAVSLILLTAALVIGIALVGRVHSERWPRFAVDGIHRAASLLAMVFLAVHIITAVLDSFAPISLVDAVIPFAGAYRPVWLGLGAAAFDLLLAVTITSVLRERLGHRAWRAVHWSAYAVWPLAVVHGLATGSDVHQGWMTVIYVACAAAFATAALSRVVIGWPQRARLRLVAVGTLVAFAVGLAVWLPGGPLGAGWARRAGTPPSLLPPSVSAPSPG